MNMRLEKINELIKRELSLMVHHELADKLGIVIIKSVKTEKDLKSAKIYFSTFQNHDQKKVVKVLQNKSWKFRKILGKKITLHDMPRLEFIYDQSQEKINKVEELLDKIYREKDES